MCHGKGILSKNSDIKLKISILSELMEMEDQELNNARCRQCSRTLCAKGEDKSKYGKGKCKYGDNDT